MSDSLFDKALKAEGVTGRLAQLARSIYMQESGGGRNTKTSNAGAMGGMQIVPKTFKSVADKEWDINDPEHNARAGIRYIKQLDQMAGGDPRLTAAGYYGGPKAIRRGKEGGYYVDLKNPNAPNTLQYADQVVRRMGGDLGEKPVVMAASGASNSAPLDKRQRLVNQPWAGSPVEGSIPTPKEAQLPPPTNPWTESAPILRREPVIEAMAPENLGGAAPMAQSYVPSQVAPVAIPDFMNTLRSYGLGNQVAPTTSPTFQALDIRRPGNAPQLASRGAYQMLHEFGA